MGWPSTDGMFVPPNPGLEYAADINETEQADYLVRAYAWSREWGHGGVLFLWNLNYWSAAGPYSEMSKYSILRADWSPRPAYIAVRDMDKSLSVADWRYATTGSQRVRKRDYRSIVNPD
jgi:hypothetical protein